MKAMIFAAGIGSRLKPLTDTTPKPLIDVGGETMLMRVARRLRQVGVTDAVVNVHHLADKMVEYIGSHDFDDLKIDISDEREMLLDTGGGVAKAAPLLRGGDVVLHNADILSDFDLADMVERHRSNAPDVTLLVSERESSRKLLFDDDGLMRGWINVASGAVRPAGLDISQLHSMAFGGIHIINQRVLDRLEEYSEDKSPKFSITDFYIDNCDKLSIMAYTAERPYSWFDIGRPETLSKARHWCEAQSIR